MKVERLCGWHGFGLRRYPSGLYLTVGRVMFIFGGRAS